MSTIDKYVIIDHTITKDGIDLNNAKLEIDYSNGHYDSFSIRHLTANGYYSKSPLYLDFDFKVEMDGDVEMLVVSHKVGESIRNNYTDLNGKIFQTWYEKASTDKAVKIKALCSVINDPYDRA